MGNVIIPLVIIIILGIVYIIPRIADKNEKIANTRIEDRFSSNIRVLDTSIKKYVGNRTQCSTRRIHPANNKNVKAEMKNGLPMTKISALRIKHTNNVRMLAGMKAEHAAKNAQREVSLRIRMGLFIGSVLTAFAMLGIYFASVIAFYWILIPVFFAISLAIHMNSRAKKDKQNSLNEKRKIIALQKEIKKSSQVKSASLSGTAKIKDNSSVNIKLSDKNTDLSSKISIDNENFIIDEITTENDSVEVFVNNKSDMQNVSKWTVANIPSPLYARINAEKSMQDLVSSNNSSGLENNSVQDLSIKSEESKVYRPNVAKPIQDAVTTDELVEKEVRFDLETVLRSRTAG